MRVLLIRHGTSTWNTEERWQGWADPPLSPEGGRQAEAMAAGLSALDVRSVVSSDLSRARSTAAIIAGAMDVELGVEPGLRERDVGLWTGLTPAEVEERWPGRQAAYRADPNVSFPEGEEAATMVRRAVEVLEAVARREPAGGVAVVVSHGGLIRCVRVALGGPDRSIPGLAGCWIEWCGDRLCVGDAVDAPGGGHR